MTKTMTGAEMDVLLANGQARIIEAGASYPLEICETTAGQYRWCAENQQYELPANTPRISGKK